ncbi:SRPBCC family protein [Novosphingobium sp. PY1]|uniref:aromatic ring-hydroxylating oxygenase subunit alpha n=1 Tax=Novosphingobium sp. PY1 TaxID=1882221 RepID=UPI000BE78317|nr:aromatic ring-hydroxylating dioxygenase subunit alpha [Novosphingobium sp. PY1]BBA72015.1 putative Rieske oxygenase [Novosphingobium sp. PY1]GFM28948.1 Rieske (2Fe-2S) domain-containing protein [Novosphingobium sp. PY1]
MVTTYRELLDADSRSAPEVLRADQRGDFGHAPICAKRYIDQAFFDCEVQMMWSRVWQMACREEDIPEVGDVHVYDIIERSVLVVRSAPDRIEAFPNSCLHRGRKLMDESGRVETMRCGFHGWSWNLDGSIRSVPCRQEFAGLSDADLHLPQIRVGRWGGFVFINFDRDGPSLEDYLGVVPRHFERWRLEDRWKAVHVARVIPCNWKVAQEAFMESYHVIATHPQILPFFSDVGSQYDVYGPHVNRNLAAFGEPSPHLPERPGNDEVIGGMLGLWGRKMPENLAAEAVPAREFLGEAARSSIVRATGGDLEKATDAEMLDAIVYNVFPNFAPWGGFAPNIVYRWRPNGRAVDSCIMEVMILKPVKEGEARPRGVPVHWLGEDEPWSNATELPALGPVIDQDMANMPQVQTGLKASLAGTVQLAGYMESRIRHFHETLDAYLEGRLPA